jgi:hypothetical protein
MHAHPQHNSMIVNTLMPKVARMEVIGCYAMTELGNGSNLRFLETTATYHKPTQEFIINTSVICFIYDVISFLIPPHHSSFSFDMTGSLFSILFPSFFGDVACMRGSLSLLETDQH